MAKHKPKISATQRDKVAIEYARILKKNGILSKQTKLHSGHYISKGVLAKVRKFAEVAELDYKAYPASKKVIEDAKSKGFLTAGNKVIGPKKVHFQQRLKEGLSAGVRPVKGGLMEQVYLPHTVMDMAGLLAELESGKLNFLKMPHEMFAFKMGNNESFRAFSSTEELRNYLTHYKSIFDPNGAMKSEDLSGEFDAFTLHRMHPETQSRNLRGETQRAKDRKKIKTVQDRRDSNRLTRAQKIDLMHPQRAARERAKLAEKAALQIARIKANPAEYEAYKAAGRERAAMSYARKKEAQIIASSVKGKGKKK